MAKDCRSPNGGTYGQTGQARLNAIIPEGAGFDVEGQQNLEGTITLFHTQVKVLFDTGASNSFVSVKIMCELGLVPQALKTALNAISPLGVTVKLGKVCRDCPLTLEGRNFPGDLVVLSMSEFDVILGMDWLSKHGATLDCVSRTITFSILGYPSVRFHCNPLSDVFLTSSLAAIESMSTKIPISQMPIVQDFEDIFQEISGLPPKREIDFCIELVPGTSPISKTPYRMAPTEMQELKKQVQE